MRIRPRSLMAITGALGIGIVLLAMEMPGRLGYVAGLHRPATGIVAVIDAQELFREHCAGCHTADATGIRGAAKPHGVPIIADSLAPRNVLAMRIAFGSGTGMPAWEGRLSREEIWALADFLDGLRE